MADRMTSFMITEKNDIDIAKVKSNMDWNPSYTWIINKALSIYLQNKLGVNAKKRGK